MNSAFIIMQIGNLELDSVYAHAIVPALKNVWFWIQNVWIKGRGRLKRKQPGMGA